MPLVVVLMLTVMHVGVDRFVVEVADLQALAINENVAVIEVER